MIDAYGGCELFYSRFYIGAVSPLGFVMDGKNMNYYDNKQLTKSITPFAVSALRKQLGFGMRKDVCFCLGEGENHRFLSRLNKEYKFFRTLVPLPHPRFIMQYRRKKLESYVRRYISALSRYDSGGSVH